MRDTQNTEARRPITRTFEGVKWTKHTCPDHNVPRWVASIPGTPLAVVRRVPCALLDEIDCFIAVPRRCSDGVLRFLHFDGSTVAGSYPLTMAEKQAIWKISERMPFWTVPINMRIRYPRFYDVRQASRVVADLRRAVTE